MMPFIYTGFTKNLDCFVANPVTLEGISNEIGTLIDYCRALVPDITLAFIIRIFKNFPFGIFCKSSNYFYHTNTSITKVMIDSYPNISYPLAKRLEGMANGARISKGNRGND